MAPDPRIPPYLGRVLNGEDPAGTCFQVAPGVLVTAWHVVDRLGAGYEGAVVQVDPLAGGPAREARVTRADPPRDLAVLVAEEPLPGCVPGLAASDELEITAPVIITGVSELEDPGRSHRYLDADGHWAGAALSDGVRIGRVAASAATPGMSGAPVMTLPAGAGRRAVAGIVSARYNSRDGWARDSVWVIRTEDLRPLLAGLTGITWLPASARPPRVKRAAVTALAAGSLLLAVSSVLIYRSLNSGLRAPVPGNPIPAGSRPYGIAITRSGLTAYVTDFGSDTVTPINLRTSTPDSPIIVGNQPYGIAITPDGRTAYVTNFGDGTVTPINLRNDIAGPPIKVGNNPQGIAITPDGKTAYVADHTESAVTPISLPSGIPGPPIPVGPGPNRIAITPDGKTVYVTDQDVNTITPIHCPGNTPGQPIIVAMSPDGIAITPDGKTAYTTDNGFGKVTPIDLDAGTAEPSWDKDSPIGIVITRDGKTAYIANYSAATVTPISLPSGRSGIPIQVGDVPIAIAITPDGKTAYVANSGDNTVTPIRLPG